MADVISSVTSLFPKAIQAFEFIQVARAFVDTASTYQSRLAILQLRLSRCGEAAGLNLLPDSSDPSKGPQHPLASDPSATRIEDILDNIDQTLKKARVESDKWAAAEKEKGVGSADDETYLEPRYRRLKASIRKIVEKRCSQVTTGALSVKWALYKKEQCEALAETLSDLIGQLEDIIKSEEKLKELSQTEVQNMGENLEDILEVIRDVKIDPYLMAATSAQLKKNKRPPNIGMHADTNHGFMIGQNEGGISNISLGQGYTVNHHH
ncbi:hypothetical protein FPANT_8743 [Fusarium pseudoanthophilum]|uniref:Prion-inhibition and propagation HeLo domain-containing protein n=1 Tax=Fusarium pseudoanthophilum TaxID=48495 RepID=A0A8H5P041_9HYPO|nr:hypothetical protein FPANT_8743 [Fusarium pseudoanthophilum]